MPPIRTPQWTDKVKPLDMQDLQCHRCGVWNEEDRFTQVEILDKTLKDFCLECVDEYVIEFERERQTFVKRYH